MNWSDTALVLLILTNLRLLGGSRIMACITTVALQGLILGVLPLVMTAEFAAWHVLALSAISIFVKAGLLPKLLRRAVREAKIQREVSPVVGQTVSLWFGLFALAAGVWATRRLGLDVGHRPLGGPVVCMMVFGGLFLVVARRQALTQVLGYLVLENGIFLFGLLFAQEMPGLVEMAALLDVLVSVFVMGIAIFHIQRAFDDIDSDRLAQLHDLVMLPPMPEERRP